MKALVMTVKCTLTQECLGSQPNKTDVYDEHLMGKAIEFGVKPEIIEQERDGIRRAAEQLRKTEEGEAINDCITVFPVDDKGWPYLYDYQIKGGFKEACSHLSRIPETVSKEIRAYKKVILGSIHILDRINRFDTKINGTCQRPLRAQTAQGERIALACSQTVPAGASVTYRVAVLEPKLKKAVLEWLDYGEFVGMGQWRSSGKGRYTYEIVSEGTEDVHLNNNG